MRTQEQPRRIHKHPSERPWRLRRVAEGVYKVDGDCDDKLDNRYKIIVESHGQQVRRTACGLTYAKQEQREMRGNLDRRGKRTTVNRNITVRELLEPALATTTKKKQHDPNTTQLYHRVLAHHFWPEWGQRKARELVDAEEMTDWLAEMIDTVGISIARRCEQFLRSATKLAFQKRLTDENPLEGLPWVAPLRRGTTTYLPAWSEIMAIRHDLSTHGASSGGREMALAKHDVLIGTGVRMGECFGFGPDDLDQATGLLTVRVQVKRLDNDRFVFDDAKSDAGDNRLIPAPKFVTAALAATQLRNGTRAITLPWVGDMTPAERRHYAATGERPTRTRELFFFSLRDATMPGDPGGFSGRLHRIGAKIGAKGSLHAHCYRHRYTITLLDGRVPQNVIDSVTGHASKGVTLGIYGAHVTPEGLDTAREAITAAWAEASTAFTPPAHGSSKAS